MFTINYKEYTHTIKGDKENPYIFDVIRKKWLSITPEEWVRQNFIQYLITEKNYPKTVIAVEKQIKVYDVSKRFDIVIYNQQHQPYVLIECKKQQEPLTTKVLEQIMHYQSKIQATYLIITNGNQVAGYFINQQEFVELTEIPDYSQL